MFTLKLLSKLFNILGGNISPRQIAGGFAFGAIIGLTPTFGLQNLFVLLLICIIRVNVATAMFSGVIFGLLSFLLDPVSAWLGYILLVKMEFLKGFWTFLYNLPIIPLSKFNNTLVMGSMALSLILFIPNLILVNKGVVSYRTSLKPRVDKMKIVQALKATSIYQWYERISNLTST